MENSNGPSGKVLNDRSLTIVRKIANDWQKLTPKRQTRKRYMKYEEMLMQEIPGASKKTNQAMHAVLESDLEETEDDQGKGMGATVKVRNHALIHYIAQLASSNNDNDTFDFSFVESLIKNGADINARDKHGQTIFHEVSRSWHLDVAQFLLKNGARIDQQDKFGRAPLHVAAAVDYAKMVEFLINNGADVNIKTTGEEQSPIHFAAKNDACLSLKMLLAYGADMGARDYQERTPLQVAAEMSRSKAAKLLIDMGAPAGVYDIKGEVALSLLILKMPDVALIALDQFHSEDMINRKEYYFLNYLEGPRLLEDKKSGARTPLEVAIQTQQFDIVMHPVMQRLVYIKWQKFGRQGAWLDLATNLLFSILWTVLGVTMPHDADKLYKPLQECWWRLVLAILVMFLTFVEIFKQIASIYRVKKSLTKWKGYREKELERDLPYCHPRWPEEKRYLDSEIKSVREERLLSSQDSWFYIDWLALLLILASGVSHAMFFFLKTREVYNIHIRFVCLLLIVIWFRIMKYARPFKGPGPFVALFSHMLGDILKWVFLFLVFFIPYTACFWMIFGSYSVNPAAGYKTLPTLLYSVFRMTVLDDYAFDKLSASDPVMSRVLCGSYISICSIIILNLLIALLADTFTRVYENAIENAAMQRAKTILNLEQSLRKTPKKNYYDFVRENCSPEMKDYTQDDAGSDRDNKRQMEEMRVQVNDIYSVINDRFGKRFGEAQKSDLDELLDKMSSVAIETSKIQTSLQLTMIRLKVLEQTVNTNVPIETRNPPLHYVASTFPRRPSAASVKSTCSEKKPRSIRDIGKVAKQRVQSDPGVLKKLIKGKVAQASNGTNASTSGHQKRKERSQSRASRRTIDEERYSTGKVASRPGSRDGILGETSNNRAEQQQSDYVSPTDDELPEMAASPVEQPTIFYDQRSLLSSEGESNVDLPEDESSSFTADVNDKKQICASPVKQQKVQKQSSLTKMPKTLVDVFKKAKRKPKKSGESSSKRQTDSRTGEEDRLSETTKGHSGYGSQSEVAPLASRDDISDTSGVTTDN